MKHTPWIERKFNFDFPLTHLPFIIERLKGTAIRISDLADGIPEERLIQKPLGKWSLKEHIGHLGDLEELHLGRMVDFKNKLPVLRAADMSNLKTAGANHNANSLKDLLNRFSTKRKEFILTLLALNEEENNFQSLHPRLKVEVRPVDIGFFVAEHDDHHLVLMRELTNK
jgi:hypothetical protein